MRLSEWTPEIQAMRTVINRLEVVAAAIARRDPQFPKLPQVEVAADRIHRRRMVAAHRKRVAIMLPTPGGDQ